MIELIKTKENEMKLYDPSTNEFVDFDRKNILHVMAVKMKLLINAANTLLDAYSKIENGKTISDCSTDVNDTENLETYWLDALFTSDELKVNAAKHDQLSLQVDKDGNWY